MTVSEGITDRPAGDVDVVIIVPEVRQDKAASEVHLAVRRQLLDKVAAAAVVGSFCISRVTPADVWSRRLTV